MLVLAIININPIFFQIFHSKNNDSDKDVTNLQKIVVFQALDERFSFLYTFLFQLFLSNQSATMK